MKRDIDKFKWIAQKLKEEQDVDVSYKQIKDKITSVKKTGNSKMKTFVLPLVRDREKERTGAAVDDDDDNDLDWEDIVKRAKWPLLKRYYELFNAHPTMGIALGTDTASSSEEEDCDTGADTSAAAADANAGAAGLVLQVQVEDDEVDEALPVLVDEDYGVGDDGPGSERDVPPSSSDNEDNEQAVAEQPARGAQAQVAVERRTATPNTPPTRIVRGRTQTVTPPQQEQQRQFLDGMGAILDGQAQQTLAIQAQLQQQQQQFEERMRQQHEDKDARAQERHQQFVMTMQQSMMTFQGTLMQNLFGRRRRHASSSDSD
eukprot:scpid90045/ scgid33452/ 